MPVSDVLSKPKVAGYSAQVDLQLRTGEYQLGLSHTAHEWVILDQPGSVAAGPAQVIITVDGVTHIHDVEVLAHEAGVRRIPIRSVA